MVGSGSGTQGGGGRSGWDSNRGGSGSTPRQQAVRASRRPAERPTKPTERRKFIRRRLSSRGQRAVRAGPVAMVAARPSNLTPDHAVVAPPMVSPVAAHGPARQQRARGPLRLRLRPSLKSSSPPA